MKLITLIIALLMSVNVFSQKPEQKTIRMCLDSIVSPALYKESFSYDKRGNVTMQTRYNWKNNAWLGNYKDECAYDENDSLVLRTSYSWDNTKNDWEKSSKTEYAFYKNENQKQETNYNWDAVKNEWMPNNMTVCGYDANGNMIWFTIASWNAIKNDWEITSKSKYVYDKNGNVILYSNDLYKEKTDYAYDTNENITIKTRYYWGSNDWHPYEKTDYTYNNYGYLILEIRYPWEGEKEDWREYGSEKVNYARDNNGNITSKKNYSWDAAKSDWKGIDKNEYTYDVNVNTILLISYTWDAAKSDWQERSKEETAYNSKGNKTLDASYSWVNNDWRGSRKVEHYYDNNLNMTFEKSYNWDTLKNDWIVSSISECIVDESYSIEELALPYQLDVYYEWLFSNFNNMLVETKHYEMKNNNMEYTGSRKYYYSQVFVGIVETHCNASLRVYPNPAKNQLTIDCRDVINHVSTVEIYDVVGQLMQSAPMTSPNPSKGGELAPSLLERAGGEAIIDISHLPAGMYFLRVGNKTARFVKE